jgi:hypothetical protein
LSRRERAVRRSVDWELIDTERRRLADDLEPLTPEQWATQSQCDAWDGHHVAAHIISPFNEKVFDIKST